MKLAILALSAIMLCSPAFASKTMSLVDEYRDGDHKTCVYSDGRNTDEVQKSLAGSCPSKHISY